MTSSTSEILRLFETLLICLNSDLGLVLHAESSIVENLDKVRKIMFLRDNPKYKKYSSIWKGIVNLESCVKSCLAGFCLFCFPQQFLLPTSRLKAFSPHLNSACPRSVPARDMNMTQPKCSSQLLFLALTALGSHSYKTAHVFEPFL